MRWLIVLILIVSSACQVKKKGGKSGIVTNHTTNSNSFTVTLPNSGWKKLNDQIDVVLSFPTALTVTGTPSIEIDIGGSTKQLSYVSGSGTQSLLFRYTVQIGDLDTDGISVQSSITLNGGTIQYSNNGTHDATQSITVPARVIKVDGIVPVIVSTNSPADGQYTTGAPLTYIFTFSEPIFKTGSPFFNLNFDSGVVAANYASGIGTMFVNFIRSIRATDYDADGISSAALFDFTSGTLHDEAGNVLNVNFAAMNSPSIIINKLGPQVVSISSPANSVYLEGQSFDFTLTFDEAVNVTGTPRLSLNLTTGTSYAQYVSGSGTSNLVFRHTVLAGEQDHDGIVLMAPIDLNAGSIKNLSGNLNALLNFTSPTTPGVLVDARDPEVISITKPTDGTYTTGQVLDFIMVFNENVTVTGTPRLPFVLGSITRYLNYTSGSGTSALHFQYTVNPGDIDLDGIALNGSIDLNSGSLVDQVSRNAVLSYTVPTTSGILIDAAPPAIVLVSVPADKTYKAGEILDFNFTFNKSVVVTGSPRLQIDVGGVNVFATYLSGSGTSLLKFRYTVQNGDQDNDGIALVTPLDLNGGTIRNGTNDANVNFNLPTTTGIFIDTLLPLLTNVTTPANGTYGPGQYLTFTANFNKPVFATPTTRIGLNVGGSTVYAVYHSGSGTNQINYRYQIQNGDIDLDGVEHLSPILLNSGTVRDIVDNDSTLAFTPADTSSVIIDNVDPSIISIIPPINGTYSQNENMDFVVNFSETVTITGLPRIPLSVGSDSVYLTYVSGSGTASAVFRYIPTLNQIDNDGVTVSSPLDLNGGAIKDDGGNDLTPLSFLIPTTNQIYVNGLAPAVSSVTPPSNKTYGASENIDFTLNFNKNVLITGVPRLSLVIGSSTVYANYLSGTGTNQLTFRYTVQTGDLDNDGISLSSPLSLNGGTIRDSGGNNSSLSLTPPILTSVLVDGTPPTITLVTPPANGTYSDGQSLNFTLVFNKAVTLSGSGARLLLTIGSSNVYATYISGSGTNSLLFRYIVQSSDSDSDGITLSSPLDLNGGTLKDAFNNSASLVFTPPTMTSVLVDATPPYILSVTGPSNATYIASQTLNFTVNFNKPITVTGTPRLNLTVGSTTVYANYLSGSSTSSLIFRYTVQTGDFDNDGITVSSPVSLNGGTLKDASGTNSSLSFSSPNTSSVYVDGLLPQILSVIAPPNGAYEINQNLDFTVNFNKQVDITGTPRISVTLNSGTVFATYLSGSGTTTATFRYQIQSGDNDPDGIVVNSPLQLNAGTIKDSLNNNSSLTFTPPTTTGVVIDAIPPQITSVTLPTSKTYIIGEQLNFVLNYNKAVTVTGSPRLTLDIGGTTVYASYVSGSTTTALTFRYTVLVGDLDSNGIGLTAMIDLNGASIKDASNQIPSSSFTAGSTAGINIDGIRPTIVSVTGPANKTYIIGETLDFTVTWSENVSLTGTPRIALDIGGTPAFATYFSGTGTNTAVFRYTIVQGLEDTNGITVSSPISLNGGAIKDVPGNDIGVLTYTTPNTTGVLVDGIKPFISSFSLPADSTYTEGSVLNVTVNWSETVLVSGGVRLPMVLGSGSKNFSYISGSSSNATLFRYTVSALSDTGDEDLDGIVLSSPLDLNGQTITDAAGNSADLTFSPPVTSGLKIDAKNPTILSINNLNSSYKAGSNLDITVNFSEPVTITGTPKFTATIDVTSRNINYFSGSGTSTIVFRYTVASDNSELDIGGLVGTSLALNAGTIRDSVSHNANITHTAINYSKVNVIYSNMVAWYDFRDSSTVSTSACAAGNCVNSVGDKTGTGNNITMGSSPRPAYVASGYGTQSSGYLDLSPTTYLNIPSITTAKSFVMALRSDPVLTAGKIFIGGATDYFGLDEFFGARHVCGPTASQMKQNGGGLIDSLDVSPPYTFGATWAANTNYVYYFGPKTLVSAATMNLTNYTLGDTTDGWVAELIIMDNSAVPALTEAQYDKIRNQVNAKHGAY